MKKQRKIGIVAALGIVIVAIIIFCVIRLIIWDHSNVIVDTDVEPGYYAMECMDYYVYPDEKLLAERPDDGVEDILVLGNAYANNFGSTHSIVNILKKNLDAKIYDLSTTRSFLTSVAMYDTPTNDGFSLFYQVSNLIDKDISYAEEIPWKDAFSTRFDKKEYLSTFKKVDLDKIDTIMIMFSLSDYYGQRPTMVFDGEDRRGYHGALYSSIKLLQDNYPHLSIIVVSPYPTYLRGEDGEIIYSNATDYGWGNASVYIDHQYAVATELCVSYIDNYFYVINDSNIEEYVDELNLSEKGITTLGAHIVNFLNDRK